jgi:phosphoribosyl-ATP pyrophosphohydrolase
MTQITNRRARPSSDPRIGATYSNMDGHRGRTDGQTIERLHQAVLSRRGAAPSSSRTAKLLAAGRAKMAQKLGEEAVEVAIDAMRDDRGAVVAESADVLYHLVVLWAEMGIAPDDVWEEMARREAVLGIAEKLPKEAS